MSIWKEIKKSINSDLNMPLNELGIFPKSIIQSQNVLFTLKEAISVGNGEQKVTDYDIKFFCKGTIGVRANYNVGKHTISQDAITRGEFYIKINGNVVKTVPLLTKEYTDATDRAFIQTIDVNYGDILSCSAFINEHAASRKINVVEIRADVVLDAPIEVLES